MEYYFCFDVGGTYIKTGIIDKEYNVLFKEKFPTKTFFETHSLSKTIYEIALKVEKSSGFTIKNCSGFGVGLPGMVNNSTGVIEYIKSLNLTKDNFKTELQNLTDKPVIIANDAELATMAEQYLGAGKNYSNFAMLTLGTGIGCGVVINNKSIRTSMPFSCEYGHSIFENSTSYEQLASTKALETKLKETMKNNPKSVLWQKYSIDSLIGSAVFEYKDTDPEIKQIFETYIQHLGNGIVNLYNLLTPELIIIGGGISNEGQKLIAPLSEYVNSHIFARNMGHHVNIVQAKLTNNAGILGARCLFN